MPEWVYACLDKLSLKDNTAFFSCPHLPFTQTLFSSFSAAVPEPQDTDGDLCPPTQRQAKDWPFQAF